MGEVLKFPGPDEFMSCDECGGMVFCITDTDMICVKCKNTGSLVDLFNLLWEPPDAS